MRDVLFSFFGCLFVFLVFVLLLVFLLFFIGTTSVRLGVFGACVRCGAVHSLRDVITIRKDPPEFSVKQSVQ